MQDLTLALVQTELAWECADKNLAHLGTLLASAAGGADIVILPEVFGSGFSMDTGRIAQTMSGQSVQWMQAQAETLDSAVCGSLAIREGDKIYNRFVFATPGEAPQSYDKRHLFRMGGEHNHYAAGSRHALINWRGWRISPMVCYDLRFPAWCRNNNDYDLQIFVANWPQKRADHWRALLIARAIENQAYVAGVNRIGSDGKDISYQGDSLVVDPRGEVLVDCEGEPTVRHVTLDKEHLDTYRTQFPAHLDADSFNLE